MSALAGGSVRGRRARYRERRALLERLECRRVLSADFGIAQALSQLTVDYDNFASDSIIVRLEEGAIGLDHWDAMAGEPSSGQTDQSSLLRKVDLGPGMAVEDAIALFSNDPRVAYAEPDYRIQLAVTPDDPRFDELWGLHNTGQTGGVNDVDIDAPEAWEVTQGSSDTIVAVIDTGVDYRHPDLADNMWVNQAEQSGLPGVDDDGNGYVDDIHGYDFFNRDGDPLDDHDHGTHVAGTIGAVGDDGVGVVGVNWDVQIMALKFLSAQGSGAVSGAIEAINYAVANGATISNNSWGDYNFSQALHDAIADADQAGHIVVAAAGNGGFGGNPINNDIFPFFPASYEVDNVISVAAIDHEGEKASFSNFGQQSVDLGAPGVAVLSTTIGNTYKSFNGTSMASPHVAGVVALVQGLFPEWSHHEVIAQVLGTTDPLPALAGISTTGGRVNAASSVGNPETSGPEVLAHVGPQPIINGQTVIDFGVTPPGTVLDRVINVRNIGDQTLTVTGPASIPAGFTLVSGLGASTLAPGEQTSMTLRIDAIAKGTYGGTISLVTNDSDENPLEFDVTGEVDFIPIFRDNGDQQFSTVGQWDLWSNQGFQGDVHESFPGNGSEVATWTFDNMATGLYQVSATWTPNSNRATNAPFRVYDDGTLAAVKRVDQQASPADFNDAGVGWEDLDDLVAFTGGALTVELSDDADGRLNADGIRVKRIDDLPAAPDVVVFSEDFVVEDGAASVDFGATSVGGDVVHTFTVRNEGLADLDLIGPITAPTGFVVTDSFGQTTLASGETTSFTLTLDATNPGTFGGTVQFGTNDPDEAPFDFLVTGSVELPPILIDNGDAQFTTIGEWTAWANQGYLGDVHESLPGTGADVASWTFDNLPPGRYQASATWTREFNRATNAPFAILDGALPVDLALVDQTLAPAEFVAQGATWDRLGQGVTITSGSLVVQLSDNANGRLNADAILVQRIGDIPAGPELVLSSNGQAVSPGGQVDFGFTPPGSPLERTFTLRNTGSSDLVLNGPITTPVGFTMTAGPSAITLAPGESTDFTLTLDAVSEGVFAGDVSIPFNDPAASPLVFSVTATVEDLPIVLDNAEAGFATVGEWTHWTNQGFGGDVHESFPGSGDDIASWNFTGLNPGIYHVAATWTPNQNRASDAPYAIREAGILVGAAKVDQQQGPAEFFADGVYWDSLATGVAVLGDSLAVELADNANGRLNADAVRIERISGLVSEPAAEILSDQGVVPAGGSFDFGSTSLGAPLTQDFVLRNVGAQPLELTSSPSIPAGFTLTQSFSPTTLASGQAVQFSLRLDALAEDLYAGEVAINTSDPGVGVISFQVSGLVAPPPQIIDNGDAGFSTVGEWTLWGGQGFGWDVHESLPGSGADVATWDFGNLLPGRYSVAATWTTWINRATNSPYTVLDGGAPLGAVVVNQQIPPNGFVDQGVWWQELGEFDVATGALSVELDDAANGRLNADAIRVEYVSPLQSAAAAAVSSRSAYVVLPRGALLAKPEQASALDDEIGAGNTALDTALETLTTYRRPDFVPSGRPPSMTAGDPLAEDDPGGDGPARTHEAVWNDWQREVEQSSVAVIARR